MQFSNRMLVFLIIQWYIKKSEQRIYHMKNGYNSECQNHKIRTIPKIFKGMWDNWKKNKDQYNYNAWWDTFKKVND